MKESEKLVKTTAISLTILMMVSIMLIGTVPANAQEAAQQPTVNIPSDATDYVTVTTEPLFSVTPALIGVGQPVLVNMWVQPPINARRKFVQSFLMTITKPDGSEIKVGPMNSYPADGTAWFQHPVDAVGEWTFKFDFLGQYFPEGRYLNGIIVTNNSGTNLGAAYYKPGSPPAQTITVQSEMVMSWPVSPLPTDYWTRPVALEHREWWPILGNFPGTGYVGGGPVWDELYPDTNPHWSATYNFHPWVTAPNSPHIVWKRQGGIGGLIGGSLGTFSLTPAPGYPSLIYAGRAYQTYGKPGVGDVAACYDIRTGEIYYEIPTSEGGITPNELAYVERTSTAVQGEEAMMRGLNVELLSISGGYLRKIDPFTGALAGNYSIDPLTGSGGTYYMNEYVLAVQNLGNSVPADQRYRLINWTTNGNSNNFASRVISNTSYARSNLPSFIDWNVGIGVRTSNIAAEGSPSATGVTWAVRITGYNLLTGEEMWSTTTDNSTGLATFFSTNTAHADHGKFACLMNTGQFKAWDLYTGKEAWEAPIPSIPWGTFGPYHRQSAYGYIYSARYDGVHAISWETGEIVWSFNAETPFAFETGYKAGDMNVYSFHGGGMVADGKLYVAATEHTPSQPNTRGWKLYCLDAFTGEKLWEFAASQVDQSRAFTGAVADGYLAFASEADGYMYVFGMGKTATTVTAPDYVVPMGEAVVIKGTVLDMSPGQPGTPCVAKESMTLQMEYLHKQFPIAGFWGNGTIVGVPVALTAIDADGNVIDIGTATTNGYYGTFSYAWTPPDEGSYEIFASFAADESYGSSGASTAVVVGAAPEELLPVEIPQQVDNSGLLYGILAGVVVAVVLAAVAVLAVLRKK